MPPVQNISAHNCLCSYRGLPCTARRLLFILSFAFLSFISVELNAQTATISVNDNVICQNEQSTITFTGTGGAEDYTFNYTLNGNPLSIGNGDPSVTLNVPNTPGTFAASCRSPRG